MEFPWYNIDLDTILNYIRTSFFQKDEIMVYQNKILEKLNFLATSNFEQMPLQEKIDFFFESIRELKILQTQHFDFLKNQINLITKVESKQIFSFSINYKGSMQTRYSDEDAELFFMEKDNYSLNLEKFLKVFNSIELNYKELNQKNRLLLNDFFESFQKNYDCFIEKKELPEFYLSVLIPKNYEPFHDEKMLFLTQEEMFQLGLNMVIGEFINDFKVTMNEYLINYYMGHVGFIEIIERILDHPDSDICLELKSRGEKH